MAMKQNEDFYNRFQKGYLTIYENVCWLCELTVNRYGKIYEIQITYLSNITKIYKIAQKNRNNYWFWCQNDVRLSYENDLVSNNEELMVKNGIT